MKNRFWLSAALAAVGVSLLVATAFAGAASSASAASGKASAKGGTFRVDSTSDWDYVDPSLWYFSHSWGTIGPATGLRLVGYPDKEGAEGLRLRAEAAAGMPIVSKDGKTYTFTVKKGFKFSNGAPVTAANYAFVLNRALIPKMQSPAGSFLTDIVGAQAVLDGKATKASGITAKGQTLTVKLTNVAPDFIARLSMDFFPAMLTNTPAIPEGIQAPVVSAGPYYVKEWVQKRTGLLARNPYWNNSKEPWKSLNRPANVDAIQYTFGNSLNASKLRVDKGETDYSGVPPTAAAELAQTYGINKSRFFVRKNLVFWYLNLNRDQALFKNNNKLAAAVGWAIDRPQMVRQHGFLAGGRTDQILPPGMPGYKDWSIYPLGGVNAAAIAKAKSLASGNTRGGNVTFYGFNSSFGPAVSQVVQYNLKQIGLNVDIKLFDRVVQTEKAGTKGEKFDMVLNGWGADYVDPYDFINVLLEGSRITQTNNVNLSYFNDPAFNKRMVDAGRLSGDKRTAAYAALDRDLSKVGAVLGYVNTNGRYYLSSSAGCFSSNPVHGTINLSVVCKK
jgi:peptide/nickel transport system substrate-binding protein